MFPGVEQLRDIHGIQGVPWWPPGLGWWLLTAAVLALAFLIWRFRAKLRVTIPPVPFFTVGSWRWDAARRLRDLRQRAGTQDSKQTAGELSELLRRIAMARLGRDACAGLTGQDWLAWLQGNDPSGFDWSRRGQALLEVPYAPPADPKRSQELLMLIDAAYDWVEVEERKKEARRKPDV
ncbi:DUF4381 domain-containing protein [Candidatus Thiosymbion oneisti]|uniref:DUF4381 domain-containing protein n=1 Tax=Candidatus Thiosymbion oneisti TaxID=589554 RepID=UPI000B7D4257|nr:DUF4381 domain-containing protein [Candidatus Thiosymbion oneisti]